MGPSSSVSPKSTGRQQRKVKNLLLDRRFQLKYAGYLMAITTLLGAGLGLILWVTSEQLLVHSKRAAEQGEQIVQLGREVVGESKKVSAVVRMNIVKDPIYQDDPDLLEAFNAETTKQDRKLDEQSAFLEKQRSNLVERSVELERSYRVMLTSLVVALVLLVLGIGAAGIVVTHKVAGPIFKMRKHLKQVTAGELEVPWGLRKGDELVEFFDAFREMVASLRSARETQLAMLDEVIDTLGPQVEETKLLPLRRLRAELQKGL